MGLPVYSMSAPDAVSQATTLKTDPTAHGRSVIRRYPAALQRRPPTLSNVRHTLGTRWRVETIAVEGQPRNDASESQRDLPDTELSRNGTSLNGSGAPEPAGHRSNERRIAAPGPQLMRQRSPRPRSRRGPPQRDALPPLHRMSRRPYLAEEQPPQGRHVRRPGFPPAPEVNGLGDRQRSWSPDSAAEPDALGDLDGDRWETFLNTITPDPSLPSAASSFASAVASGPRNGTREPHFAPLSNARSVQNPALPPLYRTISGPLPTPPVISRTYMATPETEGFSQQNYGDNEECDLDPAPVEVTSPGSSLSSDSDYSTSAESEDPDDDVVRNDMLDQLMTADRPSRSLSRSDTTLLERLSRRELDNELENIRQIVHVIEWAADHPQYHRTLLPLLRRLRRLGPAVRRFFDNLDENGADADLVNFLDNTLL